MTPGPWSWDVYTNLVRLRGGDGSVILACKSVQPLKMDANPIAAVPEMALALMAFYQAEFGNKELDQRAKAALTKAGIYVP